jgi:hypothetical protein
MVVKLYLLRSKTIYLHTTPLNVYKSSSSHISLQRVFGIESNEQKELIFTTARDCCFCFVSAKDFSRFIQVC